MVPQRLPPFGADAADVVENRNEIALAAQLAVISDSEAVRLVANALHKIERLTVTRQDDRIGFSLDENPFKLLRQPDDRNFAMPRAADNLQRRAELPFAAVNNDKIRHVINFVFTVTPLRHLAHGTKIVRFSLGAFNAKTPVRRFIRNAAFKNDHGGNRL